MCIRDRYGAGVGVHDNDGNLPFSFSKHDMESVKRNYQLRFGKISAVVLELREDIQRGTETWGRRIITDSVNRVITFSLTIKVRNMTRGQPVVISLISDSTSQPIVRLSIKDIVVSNYYFVFCFV